MPVFPHTQTRALTHWANFSGTIKTPVPVYATPMATPADWTAPGALVEQGEALSAILAHCFEHEVPLRPIGSRWSFSSLIHPGPMALDPAYINGMLRVGPRSLTDAYAQTRGAEGFAPFWIQGGRGVSAINRRLLDQGFCLQTSGAGDGQRLGGALATGTHASAIHFGAMHDAVLGVHLLVAPDKALFLQPSTGGALTPAFVNWLQQQTGIVTKDVRDDAMFRAAQVSVGSLGLLYSAVVEAEPQYRLDQTIMRFTDRYDPALWRLLETFDASELFPQEASPPFHVEVLFHPYPRPGDTAAWLTIMFKRPAPGVPPVHAQPTDLAIASDVMGLISHMTAALEPILPSALTTPLLGEIITDQAETLFANGDRLDFPGILFGTNNLPAGNGASTEIVFDHARTREVMDHIFDILAHHASRGEHVLGAGALRFAPRTDAHLGMNIHAMNGYLEFPSVHTPGTMAAFHGMWDGLAAAGILFTCHWGQLHGMDPARLRTYFGPRVQAWMDARDRILDPVGRTVFSARILDEVGLR